VAARGEHHPAGGEQHEERAEPGVPERQHHAGEDTGRHGAEEEGEPGGDLPVGPEAAEDIVEQRSRRYRDRRDLRCGGRWGGRHGLLLTVRRPVGWFEGEVDADAGALLACLGVGEADRAAVEVGDPPGDREAEAGPATAFGRAESPEWLEDPLAVFRRDAGPLVVHLQLVAVTDPCCPDHDGAASRAVPRRVVEQVGHELPQAGGVGPEDEVGGVDTHVVLHRATEYPCLGDGVIEQRPDRDGLRSDRCLSGVDAGEVEQVLHETAHPLGLVESGRQGVGVARCDTVDEVLEYGAERGQRCAELVADVRDQLPALPVDGRQVARHRVEGPGELADLVAGGLGDADGVVAGRHPARGFGHLPQRGGHADGEELSDRQGEQDRHRDAQPHRDTAGAAEGRDRRGDRDARGHQQAELDLE